MEIEYMNQGFADKKGYLFILFSNQYMLNLYLYEINNL